MIFLLFPHQLFYPIKNLKNKKVLLIEEPLFFTQYKFHIQKLILHRASMKYYFDYLSKNNIDVEYFENESYQIKYRNKKIYIYDVADNWLFTKIKNNFKDLNILPNPNFLNINDDSKFLHTFYKNRRQNLSILMDGNKPLGGKYSFDSDNRKKLPKNIEIKSRNSYDNIYIEEAKEYVKKFESIGECKEFYYPITFEDAYENLEFFLKEYFKNFGDYQDAIEKNHHFLFHSNISSSLNIGLLDLKKVITKILKTDVAINAKEGLIRQLIGWREFMLNIYKSSHIKLRTTNYFNFTNQIPSKLIDGKSGINPLDDVINKLKISSYNHHIERLMILGNMFLLCEINPDCVYEFFMSHYIDAYDWVMVANVYGMSQYSDGGSITTKPYISSSNYILKMSNDYKKSDLWCEIWDGLYWRFLYKYKDKFENNQRMKMQISLLNKMNEDKLKKHIKVADEFIKKIF